MATEKTPNEGAEASEAVAQFAPNDYTDKRPIGDWESKYPPKARKEIFWEAIYVSTVFILYSIVVFILLYLSSDGSHVALKPTVTIDPATIAPGGGVDLAGQEESINSQKWLPASFLGYLCAWFAGGVGGSLFGLKWMYHSVAKRIWHQDRRLWRILTPHISAGLATFMILIVSSGLISIFDSDVAVRHIDILAFSFLVGYFSDKSLAKLAEVADTLFGSGLPDRDRDDTKSRDGKA